VLFTIFININSGSYAVLYNLPDSYNRVLFKEKSDNVFILIMGFLFGLRNGQHK